VTAARMVFDHIGAVRWSRRAAAVALEMDGPASGSPGPASGLRP
jgi:hypothetical protein